MDEARRVKLVIWTVWAIVVGSLILGAVGLVWGFAWVLGLAASWLGKF